MSAGRYVWYDLMTTDPEGAKAFYGALFGWRAAAHGPDYVMWTHGERGPFGGLLDLPQTAQEAGAPSHWLGYVGVADAGETAAAVARLGGTVLVPPTAIEPGSEFTVIRDPQGAVFAAFSSDKDAGWQPPTGAGSFSWAELNTTDWEAARGFYAGLFGWQETGSMQMGPDAASTYWMFGVEAGKSMGGMSNAAAQLGAPPHWSYYLTVADIDEALAQVRALGGKVLNGPMDIPGGDRVAQCMDPQGAAFALYAEGGG